MCSVGFEPAISAGEWPQTYALDRAATGTGCQDKLSVGQELNPRLTECEDYGLNFSV
jgi:hypothetical protein